MRVQPIRIVILTTVFSVGVASWPLVLPACQTDPPPYSSIDDLPNPGRGWTTYNSVNGESPNRHYPPSTIAYYRFTWRQAEPAEGNYAFAELDAYIARARDAGQRLAFRIMPDACRNGIGVPDWLLAKPIAGWYYTGEEGSACFTPDAADPVYLAYAHSLIDAFGARYNGSPDIDHVDIGLVGDFGEWHVTLAVPQGAAMPPPAVRGQYIDWHRTAFPDTPLLMQPEDPTQADADALAYALQNGVGWRVDGWGDYRSPWNHIEDDYPLKLAAVAESTDAWRTRPVAMEMCGTLGDWRANWPERLDDAFRFAVDRHVSVLNAKSEPFPAEWVARFAEFTRHIGYRFSLASTPAVPERAARGTTARIVLGWNNLGNAPVYREYRPAVRLTAGGAEIARAVSAVDARTWMPFSADGLTYTVAFDIAVPALAPAGPAAVQAALIDPGTGLPAIKLALPGGNADRWFDLGTITLE